MRLNDVKRVEYDPSLALVDVEIDRIVKELAALNEAELVEEGVKDFLKRGAEKVNDVMMKGRVKLDQLKMNVADKIKGKHGNQVAGRLAQLAGKYAKPALMIAVVGAAMLGMDTASANEMMDAVEAMDPGQLQTLVEPQGISPKLVGALTDQMDGIFKATTEGGMRALSGEEAVQTAAKAHGVAPDQMIKHLMQNVSDKEQLVGEFKKWVGAGIKKSLGMSV